MHQYTINIIDGFAKIQLVAVVKHGYGIFNSYEDAAVYATQCNLMQRACRRAYLENNLPIWD